jgi:hypothetical protein
MVDWYPAPVSGCLRRCGKRFRPAGVLCRPRPGGRNIVGSIRRRGDPAGGSGTLAIKIPVGAGNLPAPGLQEARPRRPPLKSSLACKFFLGCRRYVATVFFGRLGVSGLLPGHVSGVVMELAVRVLARLLLIRIFVVCQVRVATIVPRQSPVLKIFVQPRCGK